MMSSAMSSSASWEPSSGPSSVMAWGEGGFVAQDAPSLSPQDRGFLLGDGVFDTFGIRDGNPRDFPAHMARLRAAAAAFGIPVPFTDSAAEAAVKSLISLHGVANGAGRLTISRGAGPRGLLPPDPAQPFVMLKVSATSSAPPAPLRALLSDVVRSSGALSSRHKTLSYIDNVEARRRAALAGCGEAVMLNERGELACASAANLFWIRGNSLFTPALDCGVLPGITRANILRAAPALNLRVEEGRFPQQALANASAAFVTNSVQGLVPLAGLLTPNDEQIFDPDDRTLARLRDA